MTATPYRASIEPDFVRAGVAIRLGMENGAGVFGTVQPMQLTITPAPEGVDTEPCLRLTDGMARALLDALADHYGGTNAVRGIREDYLHERGRVDRLIEALINGSPR
jgi:hypothetical protein